MLSPKKKTKIEVTVEIADAVFPAVIYANIFGVENFEGHKLIHFGCELPQDRLVSQWACLLEGRSLIEQKKNWLQYLTQAEFPKTEMDGGYRCDPDKLDKLALSNMVTWSRSGDYGELRFFSYSLHDLHNMGAEKADRNPASEKTDRKIKAQPLALVRTTLELQRQLLECLYRELTV